MAHHLPHMMAAADEVEEGTPGENVAVDAEDEEEQHHQQLACHPQQSAAFHHQRVEDEQQPPTQTSGSIIGTIATRAGMTLRHGITARRAPKAIAKRGIRRDAPRSSVVHTWRQATGPAKADSTKTCYRQTRAVNSDSINMISENLSIHYPPLYPTPNNKPSNECATLAEADISDDDTVCMSNSKEMDDNWTQATEDMTSEEESDEESEYIPPTKLQSSLGLLSSNRHERRFV